MSLAETRKPLEAKVSDLKQDDVLSKHDAF